ncbi:DUF4178 domain-containing protein [Paraliomyxa miuraensis]|nr:DUF4178 domain-containing protein [Paraliomyxa miuraensis]
MTIAGAFWVGVLAARRLRDWGEGRRALEEGEHVPLAIAAASGAPVDDAGTRKVRALVAKRIKDHRWEAGRAAGRGSGSGAEAAVEEGAPVDLSLSTLRVGDVVVLDGGHPELGSDFITDGVISLREGGTTTIVANLSDGDRRRWLVGAEDQDRWLLVAPVHDHGLSGEPPRNIRRERGLYTLERRGQASAAAVGKHERPSQSRAATYVYRATGRDVLWVERWGSEVLVGEGESVDAGSISLLPGS